MRRRTGLSVDVVPPDLARACAMRVSQSNGSDVSSQVSGVVPATCGGHLRRAWVSNPRPTEVRGQRRSRPASVLPLTCALLVAWLLCARTWHQRHLPPSGMLATAAHTSLRRTSTTNTPSCIDRPRSFRNGWLRGRRGSLVADEPGRVARRVVVRPGRRLLREVIEVEFDRRPVRGEPVAASAELFAEDQRRPDQSIHPQRERHARS